MDAPDSPQPPLPGPRLLKSLRAPVPFDVRTMAFAYFVGSILSVPVGWLYAIFRLEFEPPEWTTYFYQVSVIGSVVLLPFLLGLLDDRPLLKRLGRIVMLLVIIGILASTLFPMT
jgi:hypothetical protein